MLKNIVERRVPWAILGGLVTAAAISVWLAPEEATLGQGIKSVYLHVALIWAGMAGLSVAGVLGLGVLLTAHEGLQRWARTIGWVALALFAAGLVTSFVAAMVNWGGVFLAEPRYLSASNVLVLGLVVQVSNHWLPWIRVRGTLSALLVAYLGWSMATTPSVLHPDNAARASSSVAIQSTFFGLFILACLAGAWVVWYVRRRQPA
jgi:hypothetical protein